MNNEQPTPETDAEERRCHGTPEGFESMPNLYVKGDFARKLERERDEAQAQLSTVYRWIERNHPDGFIDSQTYLQNLERMADAWHDKIKAMREAIREARKALLATEFNSFRNGMICQVCFSHASQGHKGDCAFAAAIAKLQPLIK